MPDMATGFILIHGYLGSPTDLAPLHERLADHFGAHCIRNVQLPNHNQSTIPSFDCHAFCESIEEAVASTGSPPCDLIMIGHSTGGTLALAYILEKGIQPALVILASTPKQLGGSALERWERHRTGQPRVPLGDVARMVSLVNHVGATQFDKSFPVLFLQGGSDSLVQPETVAQWRTHGFSGPFRSLIIPGAGHQLFSSPSGPAASDWAIRVIRGFLTPQPPDYTDAAQQLIKLEGQGLQRFFNQSSEVFPHLIASPAGRRALSSPFELQARNSIDPIQVNIEITTRCNLKCPQCARTSYRRPPKYMTEGDFAYFLDLVPSAYRVVLAGLGEPTCHPQVANLVAAASKRGRRLGMVTNGSNLTNLLADDLIYAGIAAVTFSIDNADPATACFTRPGIQIDEVIRNVRGFTAKAKQSGVSTAVFSAVSAETVQHMPALAEIVTTLGVQAWMLTDLNFEWNQPRSLRRHWGAEASAAVKRAVRIAFASQIPVLRVGALEEFGVSSRYQRFLLYPPERLAERNQVRTGCFSPWQTLPVDVEGNVTICDCQPRAMIGNLHQTPLSDVWNAASLQAWRYRMVSSKPPGQCQSCPRF